ncbi:YggT family protein [Nitrincola alkalilacustris]|uniref:YggT family protein n=1 Tax=Nitrincola alkalilacustris TaxID=1571224 RepID=UPI00124DC350|nr:YggT family protein [Nitrincola alkalilacustris]
MGQDPIILIVRTIGEIFAFIAILRFLLQAVKADYYNPISQAVVKITQVPMAPLQKMGLRIRGLDFSPLLLAFLVKVLAFAIIFLYLGAGFPLPSIAIFSAVGVFSNILTILFWATIGSVIISWVAPGNPHPAPQILLQLTEPLYAIVRKVIPPIGGLDLSPIVILLGIQLIQSQLARFLV